MKVTVQFLSGDIIDIPISNEYREYKQYKQYKQYLLRKDLQKYCNLMKTSIILVDSHYKECHDSREVKDNEHFYAVMPDPTIYYLSHLSNKDELFIHDSHGNLIGFHSTSIYNQFVFRTKPHQYVKLIIDLSEKGYDKIRQCLRCYYESEKESIQKDLYDEYEDIEDAEDIDDYENKDKIEDLERNIYNLDICDNNYLIKQYCDIFLENIDISL